MKQRKRNIGKQTKDIEERMVEITTVHEQVHDAVIAARERMKASADKKKRDPSADFKVGARGSGFLKPNPWATHQLYNFIES